MAIITFTDNANTGGCLIDEGPSREELFDALRLNDEQRAVIFVLRPKGLPKAQVNQYGIEAHIKSIEMESGDGHSWNLVATFDSPLVEPRHDRILCWYNTKRRHGVANMTA